MSDELAFAYLVCGWLLGFAMGGGGVALIRDWRADRRRQFTGKGS